MVESKLYNNNEQNIAIKNDSLIINLTKSKFEVNGLNLYKYIKKHNDCIDNSIDYISG